MSGKIPTALTKEYRDWLKQHVESVVDWHGPVSRLDILTMLKHIEDLENEANWLAENARARWCWDSSNKCFYPDHIGETEYCVKCWREVARKALAVEGQV